MSKHVSSILDLLSRQDRRISGCLIRCSSRYSFARIQAHARTNVLNQGVTSASRDRTSSPATKPPTGEKMPPAASAVVAAAAGRAQRTGPHRPNRQHREATAILRFCFEFNFHMSTPQHCRPSIVRRNRTLWLRTQGRSTLDYCIFFSRISLSIFALLCSR